MLAELLIAGALIAVWIALPTDDATELATRRPRPQHRTTPRRRRTDTEHGLEDR